MWALRGCGDYDSVPDRRAAKLAQKPCLSLCGNNARKLVHFKEARAAFGPREERGHGASPLPGTPARLAVRTRVSARSHAPR